MMKFLPGSRERRRRQAGPRRPSRFVGQPEEKLFLIHSFSSIF